jgi:hypothetical protein
MTLKRRPAKVYLDLCCATLQNVVLVNVTAPLKARGNSLNKLLFKIIFKDIFFLVWKENFEAFYLTDGKKIEIIWPNKIKTLLLQCTS